MAIEMLLGATGAGKTYHAVTKYLPEILATGRHVVTNLPLKMEVWHERHPEWIDQIHVVGKKRSAPTPKLEDGKTAIADYPEGVVPEVDWDGVSCVADYQDDSASRPYLIIDEAATIFAKGQVSPVMLEFFRMHRHFGFDILLIVQDETYIDPGVRKNVETTIFLVNMKAARLGGLGIDYKEHVFIGSGKGNNPSEVHNHRYSQSGFELYQSRTLGGGDGKNVRKVGAGSVWTRGPLKNTALALAAFAFLWWYLDPLSMFDKSAPEAAVIDDAPGDATPVERRQRRTQKGTPYQLVGVTQRAGQPVFLVSYGDSIARPVPKGRLALIGIDLRPAQGCAAWQVGGSQPRLVLCGEKLRPIGKDQ